MAPGCRLRAVLLALIAVIVPAGAQPVPEPAAPLAEYRALVERAERAVVDGNSPSPWADPAIEGLKQLTGLEGAPPEASFLLGRAYALAGYPDLASAWFLHYLRLAPAGQEESLRQARDRALGIEFVAGCEALSSGWGGQARKRLEVAAQLAPESELVARKLAAARSGLHDASGPPILTLAGDDSTNPATVTLPRNQVFPGFAPRAVSRMGAGQWAGAAADLDKVLAVRGNHAAFAALRIGLELAAGNGAGALARFDQAYGDPVVPLDATVFTTRVVALAGAPYRVARIAEGALLAVRSYREQAAPNEAVSAWFASHELFALSAIVRNLEFEPAGSAIPCTLARGEAVAVPSGGAPPAAIAALLDPELVRTSRLVVFARPLGATGALRLRLGTGAETSFEDPPLAAPTWARAAQGGPTTPPTKPEVAALADACLPVLSRRIEPPAGARAVWMSARFLEALCLLSADAPDIADLRAMRKVAETHLIFVLVAPGVAIDRAAAERCVLTSSSGDRRFGAFLDGVAGVEGLSARAGGCGVCFPIASRAGRTLPLEAAGELSLTFEAIDGPRLRFAWSLPLPEPEALRALLAGAPSP